MAIRSIDGNPVFAGISLEFDTRSVRVLCFEWSFLEAEAKARRRVHGIAIPWQVFRVDYVRENPDTFAPVREWLQDVGVDPEEIPGCVLAINAAIDGTFRG